MIREIICSECRKHLCQLYTIKHIRGLDQTRAVHSITFYDDIVLKVLCDECANKVQDAQSDPP